MKASFLFALCVMFNSLYAMDSDSDSVTSPLLARRPMDSDSVPLLAGPTTNPIDHPRINSSGFIGFPDLSQAADNAIISCLQERIRFLTVENKKLLTEVERLLKNFEERNKQLKILKKQQGFATNESSVNTSSAIQGLSVNSCVESVATGAANNAIQEALQRRVHKLSQENTSLNAEVEELKKNIW